MNKHEENNAAKRNGTKQKSRIRDWWKTLFSRREKYKDGEPPVDKIPSLQHFVDEDVNDDDIYRVRTHCKQTRQAMPDFQSKKEVNQRIENAHKYYGIKCVCNFHPDENKGPMPSWYYILERPIKEQYELMNNYIRKLSVLASLQNPEADESCVEEEVSSISSASSRSEFVDDSEIPKNYKECIKIRSGMNGDEEAKESSDMEYLRRWAAPKVTTIKNDDYTIVIRELEEGGEIQASADNQVTGAELECRSVSIDSLLPEPQVVMGDGDHLPDMSDFDLSFNLKSSPLMEMSPANGNPSYYLWRGNSTPTKTPLLNMESQPPVRHKAPGSAKDFLTFRNLSLSSEFTQSCSAAAASPHFLQLDEFGCEIRSGVDGSESSSQKEMLVEENLQKGASEIEDARFDDIVLSDTSSNFSVTAQVPPKQSDCTNHSPTE